MCNLRFTSLNYTELKRLFLKCVNGHCEIKQNNCYAKLIPFNAKYRAVEMSLSYISLPVV
jgi:hypothetical protein